MTKKLFLISANDHLLVIFNLTGKIEYIEKFDPKIFIQPEGLPFTEKGDMFISNEGKDKSPNYIAV